MAFVIVPPPRPLVFSRERERNKLYELLLKEPAAADWDIYLAPTPTIDLLLIFSSVITRMTTVSPQFNEREEARQELLQRVLLVRFAQASETPVLHTSSHVEARSAHKIILSDSAPSAFKRLMTWMTPPPPPSFTNSGASNV